MDAKYCRESKVIRKMRVFPSDVNNHNTLFGGRLMNHLDQAAATSAARHSRRDCVTASADSVNFWSPIQTTDSVCFESYVSWTGVTSMEVFVKITTEDLKSGERKIAATALINFVALDQHKKPTPVPQVIPETEEEKRLNESAAERARMRKERNYKPSILGIDSRKEHNSYI